MSEETIIGLKQHRKSMRSEIAKLSQRIADLNEKAKSKKAEELAQWMDSLPPAWQHVAKLPNMTRRMTESVMYYYGGRMTISQVAIKMGVSANSVPALKAKALRHIKRHAPLLKLWDLKL
jgi:DNA-directed RNA polymerase specialized sigma24 family protein